MLKLPNDFINKYQQLLGSTEAEKLFQSLNQESKKAFRINSLKFNRQVSYSLEKPVPCIPNAYYGETAGNDPEGVSGTVYSQDPAAMFPAFIADVKPGEKVLDLCAAPGGKTTALGEALKNQGLLVANEISSTRVKALRENLERWGISNALITNDDSFALAKKFPNFFDLILVDAPCSGEGMFRKNPDAISYWSPDYVQTCQDRQKEILNEAVKMLAPNGRLVYSTCTFSPEEDEEIVAWLVKEHQLKIKKIPHLDNTKISHGSDQYLNLSMPELNKTLRFWPQDGIGEGQFAALLVNDSNTDISLISDKKKRKKAKNKNNLSKQETLLVAKILDKFSLPTFLSDWKQNAKISKNHVYIPAYSANLSGLKIINNGVELGLMKKNRFEPGHQLAEVLGQIDQKRIINLNTEIDFKKFLHGETLRINSELRGFVLVAYQEHIFSFGKNTGNGVLKNFYPKGLRTLKGA